MKEEDFDAVIGVNLKNGRDTYLAVTSTGDRIYTT